MEALRSRHILSLKSGTLSLKEASLTKIQLSQAEIDERNELSSFFYNLRKETPGRFWEFQCKSPLDSEQALKSMSKVLNLDATDDMVPVAIKHIKLGKIDNVYHIVVPYPIPEEKEWPDGSNRGLWIDIEQVLIWNPKTDHWTIMGDDAPQLFGNLNPVVFGHPKRFLQEWASARAIQLEHIRIRSAQKWSVTPTESDVCPGSLIVGDLNKIPWPISEMDKSIRCYGIDPKKVNQSILKSANLPFAVQGH